MEAYFEKSMVLTYAFPKETLIPLLPECLELDDFKEQYGFMAIAIVQTRDLRPKGFPSFLGNNFTLIGYRIFVRYRNSQGKRLRGLYILESETDQKKMEFLGNIFTKYNYKTTDISIEKKRNQINIQSVASELSLQFLQKESASQLPENSPFADWKEARRFAGPLPFTFTFDQSKNEVLIIEGVRTNWKPEPLEILSEETAFFKKRNLKDGIPANAFIVENIPYHWKKGKIELWIP